MKQTILALVLLLPSFGAAQECTLPDPAQTDPTQEAIASYVISALNSSKQSRSLLDELSSSIARIRTADTASEDFKDGLVSVLKDLVENQAEIIARMEDSCIRIVAILMDGPQ